MTFKELRQSLRLTQRDLADRLGIDRSALGKAERGTPRWSNLDAMVAALGGRLETKVTIGENVFFLHVPVLCKCGHDREGHDGDDHDPEDVLGECLSRDPKDPSKRSGCSCMHFRRAPVANESQKVMKRRWAKAKENT